jgi:DNA-binding transcriptional ArsR family regulator
MLFKALADPLRIQLLAITSAAPIEELSFHELAEHFSMPQSSLSHHLRILVRAGVLERRRTGTWSKYRLSREVLQLMRAALQPDVLPAYRPQGNQSGAMVGLRGPSGHH